MKPQKEGQVVKFHTPYPKENPNQLYVILEIHFDVEKPRAIIKELNGGKALASTNVVLVDDLEVAEVETAGLLGHYVSINKSDSSQVKGKVVKLNDKKTILDMSKSAEGVETNVLLTILDGNGKEHVGNLFVK
jgi:hypothetical protein